MERELSDGESVFVIRDFLPARECALLIQRSESIGYEAATLGDAPAPQVRNNARLILDDDALAAELWERAKALLPRDIEGWEAEGLNPRFRFYRYEEAESFAPHYDGSIRLAEDRESKLTFMVYLNGDCRGGETNFYLPNGSKRFSVRPECGKALIFAHQQLHEGAPVTEGKKYALRSDVIYKRRSTAESCG